MESKRERIAKIMKSHRIRADRRNDISPVDIVYPPHLETYSSQFVSDFMAFTVEGEGKVDRFNSIIDSILHLIRRFIRSFEAIDLTPREKVDDIIEMVDDLLDRLSSLIVADTRLCNSLPGAVISFLVELLDDKRDFYKKLYRIQYHSTIVLANFVCSEKADDLYYELYHAIPLIIKLIPSSNKYVQIQALVTLTNMARKYSHLVHFMLEARVLECLEPLAKNDLTNYAVLKSCGELVIAICQIRPPILPHNMKKAVGIVCTALHQEHVTSLIPMSVALSLLSEKNEVVIGTEFARLSQLIRYSASEIVISSFRTIGNYVRWGTLKDIEMLIEQDLLLDLGTMLYHKREMVRKEACWIISNLTAVANHSQIKAVINIQLIDLLVEVIRKDEFDLKIIAACAISNAIRRSNKKQYWYFRNKCVPLLEGIASDDVEVYLMISNIYNTLRKKEKQLRTK